mmetsp:Transcript_20933/g.67360  ORF Transcript_20933/g.67360 Transcript_20933/m.67360 type:complete len:260 (+) Transcript_20933:383-1162(+)
MTSTRSFTSRPRPATLVATMIVRSLFLKSAMVWSRSVWSMPPCSASTKYPARISSWNSVSTRACVSAKMRMAPSLLYRPSSCSSRFHLSFSSRTSTTCSTSPLTVERPPTMISMGLIRILRASFSTCDGKVALNMTVCLSGRTFLMISVICGSNPMSNIRSASSITTYVTRCSEMTRPAFRVIRSIMRPGVQTTISAPRLMSAICSATLAPPYSATTRIPRALANLRHSVKICTASSRAGAMISPIGPSPAPSGGWSAM